MHKLKKKVEEFSDLKNHWVKDIANKLKQSGKLENTAAFDPNRKITRADLAKYLVKINELNTNNSSPAMSFNDISKRCIL